MHVSQVSTTSADPLRRYLKLARQPVGISHSALLDRIQPLSSASARCECA